ncbi:unnamed protein product [Effrenium voratum]|nr:unnamed protein product [Effrenium voratum]
MNGTSMVGLFGAKASDVTVGHLLRMQSGLADFDVPGFDDALLKKGSSAHSPMEFLHAAASQSPAFLCDPGQCTSYTSRWAATADAKYQRCRFADQGRLNSSLSVAGAAGSFLHRTQIFSQDASILGWTCGNLVAPASSAAEFFYDFLLAKRIIPEAMVDKMKDFRPLNVGWAKGTIQYGTGLMIQQASWNASYPPELDSWGSYVGHGGDTYGFLSESGVLSQFNASFSAIANQEYSGTFVKNVMVCNMIKLAAKILLGQDVFLKCGLRPFHSTLVV